MDWTVIIVAVVGSGAVTAIVNAIIRAVENKRKQKSAETKALTLLLLGEIREFGDVLLQQNYLDEEDYRHFEELYQTHKALGGNGYADKLYAEILKMPVKGGGDL